MPLVNRANLIVPGAGKSTCRGLVHSYVQNESGCQAADPIACLDCPACLAQTRSFREAKLLWQEFLAATLLTDASPIADLPVAELLPGHLTLWINSNRLRWKSAWTVKRIADTIERPFIWAMREGFLTKNPL